MSEWVGCAFNRSYQGVHSPAQVPASYVAPYNNTIESPVRRTFAGMLSCVDEGFANVTSALRAKGMYNNTVVIFTTGFFCCWLKMGGFFFYFPFIFYVQKEKKKETNKIKMPLGIVLINFVVPFMHALTDFLLL